ncbi:MAG: hypothetical protein K0R88_580 [Solirubrobacterales bacterium]|nr:hypothetical protein [Solirubrobacterales bacterium]
MSRLAQNVRFAWQRATGSERPCDHVDQIRVGPTDAMSCPACVASGDSWRALRVCAICGEIGCCDSSKNRHAHRHAEGCGHLLVRSAEAGEDWVWCYADARIVARSEGRTSE